MNVRHLFVDTFPTPLEQGVVYVSIKYRTSAHLCLCGCGREVVTPLRPDAWTLTFDGVNISLSPSVGSRNLACKSHYFITKGDVRWVPKWMERDGSVAFEELDADEFVETKAEATIEPEIAEDISFWRKVARFFMLG